MLYLGIDLHAKQFTVNLRDESGNILLRRQVSTAGEAPREFLAETARRAGEAGYVAMLEVCGFHDWLADLLPKCGCREVILVQADERSRRKTDRRDATKLSELLWVNRHRLLAKLPVQGVRRITPPTEDQRLDRRLTTLRRNAGADRTRVLNRIKHILRRLNFTQYCPTKNIQTIQAREWLKTVALPPLDRFEMDRLLARWTQLDAQLAELEGEIASRGWKNKQAGLLKSIPGVAWFSALAIASRVGDIDRFPTPRSLGNYFGLTPSCRNSGESTQRLGSITKEGSVLVRFLLAQTIVHVLRRDAAMRVWYQRLKRRRGSKIARVAVMRRLTVVIWHMLKRQQTYQAAVAPPAGPKPTPRGKTKASLGAPPPDPRDLSLSARSEVEQPKPAAKKPAAKKATRRPSKPETQRAQAAEPPLRQPSARKKTSGRSQPPALRIEPGAGARGASQQSPILPTG
jgi:transposase